MEYNSDRSKVEIRENEIFSKNKSLLRIKYEINNTKNFDVQWLLNVSEFLRIKDKIS